MPQQLERTFNKVLMIARAFPPFLPVGHSIRVIKFIKYLPALGWEPVVLTVDETQEYETLRKVGSVTLLSEVDQNLKVHRTRTGEPSLEYLKKEEELAQRKSLMGIVVKNFARLRRWIFWNALQPDHTITWLPFAALRGRKVVKDEKIAVIFATCPPHAATLTGAVIKLLTGKPLILDFRDDWIDTPWHESKPAFLRWVDRILERWAVRTADKVVLVTEWSRHAFQNRYPSQPADKFILIPNGCDLGEIRVIPYMKPILPTSKFTILHAGSLNVSKVWGRSPFGLFQAIQNILQEQPELRESLDVVFAGDFPEEFRELADEMGLSSVIHGVGHLPHDEVLNLTRSADLLLAMNYEGWATLIPGKVYEYWAVGGPPILLLSCPGAASDFIQQNNLGFVADPYDVERISHSILNVYRQNQTGLPLKIKTDGVEAFDRKTLTCQLAQVLSMISPANFKSTSTVHEHL